jgi:hypothetical protein
VGEWKAVHDLTTKAEVVEERVNENMILSEGVWNEAYLVSSFSSIGEKGKGLTEKQPSLDIEMRYMGEKGELDVGVFAPNDLMDVGEAEKLVGEFVAIWQR